VEKDQRITIEGNADSAQYQVSNAPSKDDWDKWNSDRDHAITSAESWRHTNPYYTGSQDLDAYGSWQDVPDYGSVWFPAADPNWAPYRDGRWVYEPFYGWTWVSYEPWGWAPYHYGRWFVYGGNWGWWPGPVYAGYYPMWAPAYVSFFGFGGYGGFGSVGWLPIGPGDRFYPWYGRGVNRVNGVNVYNIHNNYGGIAPLREGSRAFSNLNRAFTDSRVRDGVSSMPSGQFGRGRVPMQQQRLDAGSFRQASVMTGSLPVTPSRESFRPSDRQVSPSAIPNRANANEHFFSRSAQAGTPQGQRSQGGFTRGGNPAGNQPQQNAVRPGFHSFGSQNSGSASAAPAQTARPFQGNTPSQRTFTPSSSQQVPSNQSTRPGWRTFTPPSGQSQPYGGGRNSGGYAGEQSRPSFSQPAESPRQFQNYSRGYSRPPLNLQQPIVTPRRGAYSSPSPGGVPSGGGYRGGYSGGASRGNYSSGESRGGYSGGGSRSGNSGGGSSSSGGRGSSGHNGR
jgi:hypothetical protein